MSNRLFRNVVDAEAQRQVQHHERMDYAVAEPEVSRKATARIERIRIEKRSGQHREHSVVDCDLPGVMIDIADLEVVKQAAVFRFVRSRLSWLHSPSHC